MKTPRDRNRAEFFFVSRWRRTHPRNASLSYGTVGVRPRTRPTTAEMAKRIIATKNTIFAASTATPAIPPKPSKAAISATIKNVTAQPNMAGPFPIGYGEIRVPGKRKPHKIVPATRRTPPLKTRRFERCSIGPRELLV